MQEMGQNTNERTKFSGVLFLSRLLIVVGRYQSNQTCCLSFLNLCEDTKLVSFCQVSILGVTREFNFTSFLSSQACDSRWAFLLAKEMNATIRHELIAYTNHYK